jgi:hypothetical protein
LERCSDRFGWLIVAVGPDVKAAEAATRLKKCPFCAELVQRDAKVCKHCGRDFAPTSPVVQTPKEKFYYHTDGEQQGPVDAGDLKLLWQEGIITNDTPVIREGDPEWRGIRDYLALLSK